MVFYIRLWCLLVYLVYMMPSSVHDEAVISEICIGPSGADSGPKINKNTCDICYYNVTYVTIMVFYILSLLTLKILMTPKSVL